MKKMLRAAALLLAALLLLCGAAAAEETELLQIHQLNVGSADAYLLICGDTSLMIDCGTEHNAKRMEMMEYLRASGIDKLDAMIITHYHADHVGNIRYVLEEFGDEQTVVYGPTPKMKREYSPLPAGTYCQMLNFDEIDIGPLHLTCVGPDTIDGHGTVNRDSLNFVLTYGSRRYLFTGDFVRGQSVIRDHEELVKDVDVFKFPHHGIVPYCVDGWVVQILQPEITLVPGVNGRHVKDMVTKYKIPETQILDYSFGYVVLVSDGETIDVHTHVEPGQFAKQ